MQYFDIYYAKHKTKEGKNHVVLYVCGKVFGTPDSNYPFEYGAYLLPSFARLATKTRLNPSMQLISHTF